MRTVRAVSLCLLACLAVTTPATASYDPLGSGATRLSFDKRFRALLKENGIKLTARDSARVVGGRTAIFPVSGGTMDPVLGKGSVELEGELLLEGSRKRVPLTHFMVKTKRSPLYAKVGGGQQKVAVAAGVSSKRAGFGSEFSATGLRLTAKTAVRLDKRLDTNVFKEGQPLGSLRSMPRPTTVAVLPSAAVTYVPSATFLAKLKGIFVSLNPIFPAELAPGPVFSLPIILGGALAPDASIGTLRSGGSIELLRLEGGQVFLHEIWVDLGAASATAEVEVLPVPPNPGKLGRIGAFGLDLRSATISSDPAARTMTVSGAPMLLQGQLAALLDQALGEGKGVFVAGESLGTLSFVAQAQ